MKIVGKSTSLWTMQWCGNVLHAATPPHTP